MIYVSQTLDFYRNQLEFDLNPRWQAKPFGHFMTGVTLDYSKYISVTAAANAVMEIMEIDTQLVRRSILIEINARLRDASSIHLIAGMWINLRS